MLELQQEFSVKISDFILRVNLLGYKVTLGETYRTPEQAAINAKKGKGIANSLHCDRLAMDINLFKDGKFLTKTSDYKEIGELWESMGGSWGGRFNDGNHFSISFMGKK